MTALALGASAALAADLPLAVKAMPTPPPAVSWTGCYVNGGGGYGMWNQDHFTETFPAPLVALSSTTTTGGRGWFGTVGGGCDYQFTALQHDFVVGALADYDFMNLSGTFQDSAIGFGDTERERSAWAAGGRIGYLVTPSVLTYVNGGYTQSRFDQVNYSVLFIPPPTIPSGSSIPAHTYRGWFIGGGTEFALEWFPGLFWRNEYRYASYGAADLPIAPGFFLGPGAAVHADKQVQTISTELVYKLNWSGQSGSTATANFPIKAPPLSAAAPNWTGCYLAGGGGYGMWNDDHFTETFPAPFTTISSTATTGGRGWFGTGGGGCDYQFSALDANIVLGAFADYDFMSLTGTFEDSSAGVGGTERERSAWAGGARAGFLVTPLLLTYVNGGFTQAHFDPVNISLLAATPPAIGLSADIAAHTYRGWFLGGGTEYALSWFPGLFWRNEYRYASYASADVPINANGVFINPGFGEHTDKRVQTIATELVYKFHWTAAP